ncbi:MAG TPA: type IV conjugative transfer system lipoprotein TraV [Gammaproteobacteria bacterium]|nr:type IV conjugative transfer system lipoprotein TraV [Gammaproteobacteria bacterium]
MNKLTTYLLGYFLVVFLTGCASNANLDCPMKPGVRCESLDRVNARVNAGEIGSEETLPATTKSIEHIYSAKTMKTMDSPILSLKEPLRSDETVMRIWIAPFEDTSGNYHQESSVFTIVKSAYWLGYPVKKAKL